MASQGGAVDVKKTLAYESAEVNFCRTRAWYQLRGCDSCLHFDPTGKGACRVVNLKLAEMEDFATVAQESRCDLLTGWGSQCCQKRKNA